MKFVWSGVVSLPLVNTSSSDELGCGFLAKRLICTPYDAGYSRPIEWEVRIAVLAAHMI
jgi:hypothetical protein